MANIRTQLEQLQNQIEQSEPGTRHRFRHQLHNLMEAMERQGENIPPQIRGLHDELLAESIEAQFDNLPV